MMQEKENDWLVSTINQPEFNMTDFINIGLNVNNTELKEKEFYKEKEYFRKQFINNDGVFDEKAFDKKYDDVADLYKTFAYVTSQSDFLDTAEFSYNNLFASDNAKRYANDYKITNVKNPFRTITGTEGVNSSVESGLTLYEIAQSNKLRDEEGNILDITANDLGALGTIFNTDTYAMATWDEDGEHEENGRMIKHKKGDIKFDAETGDPYLRALKRGEDVSGKRILNWTDVITDDGSYWNKWDVFDTDGKDVNIFKTTVRSALKVAPLLAGMVGAPVVATAYAGITAILALGQSLPSVIKALDGIIQNGDGSKKRNELWNTINAIEGFSNRFKGSTNENSQVRKSGVYGKRVDCGVVAAVSHTRIQSELM